MFEQYWVRPVWFTRIFCDPAECRSYDWCLAHVILRQYSSGFKPVRTRWSWLASVRTLSVKQRAPIFDSREQIDRLIELSQLSNLYWQFDRKDKTNLDLLIEAMPDAVKHDYVDRKREHMLNDIARDYERINELEIALALFEQTQLPPSRERRARIYDKLEQNTRLSDIVTSMLEAPINASEFEVAQKLEQRVKRKLGQRYQEHPSHSAMNIVLNWIYHNNESNLSPRNTLKNWAGKYFMQRIRCSMHYLV